MKLKGNNALTSPIISVESITDIKLKLSHYRPGQALRGYRTLRLGGFLNNLHMKMAGLSSLRTGRL
jgi:hypothetical protein